MDVNTRERKKGRGEESTSKALWKLRPKAIYERERGSKKKRIIKASSKDEAKSEVSFNANSSIDREPHFLLSLSFSLPPPSPFLSFSLFRRQFPEAPFFRETNIGIVFWCRKRKGAWIALTIRLLFAARSHWKTRCIFEQLRSLLSLQIRQDYFVKNALRSLTISSILFIRRKFIGLFFVRLITEKFSMRQGSSLFSPWLWIFSMDLHSKFTIFLFITF